MPALASAMIADYKKNQLAGDAKYKDKEITAIGVVLAIRRDALGHPIVELGNDILERVRCEFSEAEAAKLTDLEGDQLVAIHGTGTGADEAMSTPVVANASLIWAGTKKSDHLTDEQRHRIALREARSGELCLGAYYSRLIAINSTYAKPETKAMMATMISTAKSFSTRSAVSTGR